MTPWSFGENDRPHAQNTHSQHNTDTHTHKHDSTVGRRNWRHHAKRSRRSGTREKVDRARATGTTLRTRALQEHVRWTRDVPQTLEQTVRTQTQVEHMVSTWHWRRFTRLRYSDFSRQVCLTDFTDFISNGTVSL